jgi:hypothetical protein
VNRHHRPLGRGLAAATSASAVGVSINIATDHLGSMVAWFTVGACTLLAGAVIAAVERTRTVKPQPPPSTNEIVRDHMIIEMTIGPDGVMNINASADGPDTTTKLTQLITAISNAGPSIPVIPDAAALPKPLPVVIVTRSRSTGIARHLEEIKRHCAGLGELDLRLCLEHQADARRAALRDAHIIIIDDHCHLGDGTAPLVGGLDLATLRNHSGKGPRALAIVLGCHDSAGPEHTEALRRSLDRPVAFLGCAGAIPADHRRLLYPALLDELSTLAGTHTDAYQLCSMLDNALSLARVERPRLDWGRWTATVLAPADRPGGGRI